MQKVQRWSQPFCTSTKARVRSAKPVTRCGAVSRTAMMSETRTCSAPRQEAARIELLAVADHARRLRASPRRSRGSIWAAQPVTSSRASGRARLALRIAWRVWRTASSVTAQLLTMIEVVARRASSAHRLALGGVEAAAQGDDFRRSCEAPPGRSRRVKTWVAGPVIRIVPPGAHSISQRAAGQARPSTGLLDQPAAHRGDRGGAGAGAAGAGQAGAALPDAQPDGVARRSWRR